MINFCNVIEFFWSNLVCLVTSLLTEKIQAINNQNVIFKQITHYLPFFGGGKPGFIRKFEKYL